MPKIPDSDIVKNEPVISSKKPNNQEQSLDNFNKLFDNSLLTAESKKNLAITSYQPQKLIYGIPTKNQGKFSLNTSEQLPVITEKEQFLLTKIKNLEEKLAKVQAENNHLKLENKHLKALIQQEQETEAKVIQPLFLKPNK